MKYSTEFNADVCNNSVTELVTNSCISGTSIGLWKQYRKGKLNVDSSKVKYSQFYRKTQETVTLFL
jgi:hypothetical protein